MMARVSYSLDVDKPITRHSDEIRYTVFVFWLIGLSAAAIGRVCLLRKSQVQGIIGKSEYVNRSAMSDQRRQHLLDELEDIRFEDGRPLDGGLLDNIDWKIQPLTAVKIRNSRKEST